MYIISPLEQFEVVNLVSLYLRVPSGVLLMITNQSIYLVISLILVTTLPHRLLQGGVSLVPSRWQLFAEVYFFSLRSIVTSQIGRLLYFPSISSLFILLVVMNLVGNIPYGFSVTSSLVVSLGLSFTVFVGVTFLGLYNHRIKFFSLFIPEGTPIPLVLVLCPIEIISYTARAFSLGVRLLANISAGHMMVGIISYFLYSLSKGSIIYLLLPLPLFIAIMLLELGVSVIQGYVFSILVSNYLKESLDLH